MRVDISSFQCMVVEKKTHIAKRMTSLEPTDGGDVVSWRWCRCRRPYSVKYKK